MLLLMIFLAAMFVFGDSLWRGLMACAPAGAYLLLMSLEPAIAAIAGWALLNRRTLSL